MKVFKNLKENILYLDELFKDCGDIVKREINFGKEFELNTYIIYIDMLVNVQAIDETIIRTIIENISAFSSPTKNKSLFDIIKENCINKVDLKESNDFDEIVTGILSGDTVFFIEDFDKVLLISTKGFPNRGIPTVDTEVVLQGSKEAFSEVFRFNTALIRRRIRDTNLKIKQVYVGRRSKTNVAIMYIDDIVRKSILKEVEQRIKDIDIDAIFDIGYIEQFIEDNHFSVFPQTQITERPDKAASSILEGRIVVIVDNSPYALIVPTTLSSFFQASEDYYQRFEIMTFSRIIRFIAAVVSLTLPGFYLALVCFNPSAIPIDLVLKIANSRFVVPFPSVVEVVMMDLTYELLKEAGLRLPGPIGSTMGIVGGIVIGQAAVEAGFVSPLVVIVIAVTAISGFAVPNYSLTSGFRMSKYVVIIASAFLGLFGFWASIIFLLIHLSSLNSFGIPYMYPFTSGEINDFEDYKDTIVRMPLFKMKTRPIFANPNQSKRLNYKNKNKNKNKV